MSTRELVAGAAVGALLAYMGDPRSGRRRRALARDQLVRANRRARETLEATGRDTANRATGLAAAVRGRLAGGPVDDVRLAERVRAALGRVCSHPRAVDVEASGGLVRLRGPILAGEAGPVLRAVGAVRGVRGVTSQLDVRHSTEGVPPLQGSGRAPGAGIDILQRRWAPATRALVASTALAAAGACVAVCARR